MKEVWEELKTFTKTYNGVTIKYDVSGRYMISNHGNLRSLDRKDSIGRELEGRERKLRLNPNGYLDVNLHKDGKVLNCKVHRLVAETFLRNTDNKRTVNHIDGNKINNRVDNLEWATHTEQQKHAYDSGLKVSKKGEQCYNCKLTEAKVREIRERRTKNPEVWTFRKLAKEYGVSKSQIHRIISGELWKHTYREDQQVDSSKS